MELLFAYCVPEISRGGNEVESMLNRGTVEHFLYTVENPIMFAVCLGRQQARVPFLPGNGI